MVNFTHDDSDHAQALGYASIYFICREGETSPCKVGHSRNPTKRVQEHQIGSPDQLVLADAIFIRSRHSVQDLEEIDQINSAVGRRARTWEERVEQMTAIEEIRDPVERSFISAYKLEGELHAHYRKMGLRVRGEWYSGGADLLVKEAIGFLRQHYGDKDFLSIRSMKRKIKSYKEELALAA